MSYLIYIYTRFILSVTETMLNLFKPKYDFAMSSQTAVNSLYKTKIFHKLYALI